MEQKVSAWVESRNKQALGQAGFRAKHYIKSIYRIKLVTRKNTLLLLFSEKVLTVYQEVRFGLEW